MSLDYRRDIDNTPAKPPVLDLVVYLLGFASAISSDRLIFAKPVNPVFSVYLLCFRLTAAIPKLDFTSK